MLCVSSHFAGLDGADPVQFFTSNVSSELRPRLREAKKSVSAVERLNQETEEGLTDLLLGLDMLPDGGYGDRAQDAAMKAMDAQQRAEEAADKIEDILDRLPEDQRKINEIPKDIADANRDIQRAQNQGACACEKSFISLGSMQRISSSV